MNSKQPGAGRKTAIKGKANQRLTSHLFMVRVWEEEVENGHTEWRGQVQYASQVDGETHYFRDWPALASHLQAMLSGKQNETNCK